MNFGTPPPWVFLEISHHRIEFVNVTSARPNNASENAVCSPESSRCGRQTTSQPVSPHAPVPTILMAGEQGMVVELAETREEAKRVTPAEANPHSIQVPKACLQTPSASWVCGGPSSTCRAPPSWAGGVMAEGDAYNSSMWCLTAQLGGCSHWSSYGPVKSSQ